MNNSNISRLQFFELLGAGLWGRDVNQEIFRDKEPNWDIIWELSRQQAVVGLVYDAIMTLPQDLMPPNMKRWLYFTIRLEEVNKYQIQELAKIFTEFKKKGLDPILLKGQGLAQYYINPLRRQYGDFDILGAKGDDKKISEILLCLGAIKIGNESGKHSTLHLDGIVIENHKTTCSMHYPKSREKWRKIEQSELNEFGEYLMIDKLPVRTPSTNFNAFYIFEHTFHHLLRGGVSLKQFCDWARFIFVNRDKIDSSKVHKILKELGLLDAASLFEDFMVKYLGFPSEKRLFKSIENQPLLDGLLCDILGDDGSGQSDADRKNTSNFFEKKFNKLSHNLKRGEKYTAIVPNEVRWLFRFSVRANISVMWYKCKGLFVKK